MADGSFGVLASMSRNIKSKKVKGRVQRSRRDFGRLPRHAGATMRNWKSPSAPVKKKMKKNASVDCGWGRLIFAHSFESNQKVAEILCEEKEGRRDIALYLRDPHVVLSIAPQELFLDPSHTYRLWYDRYRPSKLQPTGFIIRRLKTKEDIKAMNEIYAKWKMVPAASSFVWANRKSKVLTYLVAEDRKTGRVVGSVLGVDHVNAFSDPEMGSSLWCLAVDPEAQYPGIGEHLVRHLAEHYQARGRGYMDLSVMHDNKKAIALYEKLGFRRVPVFCLKHKNAINEPLFIAPQPEEHLNPYAEIIIREARRRGISVDVLHADLGYFSLSFGGRSVVCCESLSELTSSIAMSWCADKRMTKHIFQKAGLEVPAQQMAATKRENEEFLKECRSVVVKPAHGEQGNGVTVDIHKGSELHEAVQKAYSVCPEVLLEEFHHGLDLRIVVINFKVVAAAIRRPAEIVGTGRHKISHLIQKQSRRRQAATGGESKIPMDSETERCVQRAGYKMESILGEGKVLSVRRTANLHTGGSMYDVTASIHPKLKEVAETAAYHLNIPVVGLDFLVPDETSSEYVLIEANERPGLANHEPQPTAERFIDLLFPQTAVVH